MENEQSPQPATGPVMTAEQDQPKRRDRRAAKAEKKQHQQEERAARKRSESGGQTVRASALVSMVTAAPPSREELQREAAAEFNQAMAPSMDLLQAAVPEATSAEEAWKTIESKLGQPLQDSDAELPDHPLYSGDTLVYYQLRRHYGRTSPAGSFRAGWTRGGGGGLPPILGA